MKQIRVYVIILSVLIATFSCVDDDITGSNNNNNNSGSGENVEVNEWIYDKMFDNYLWYDEIPSASKLEFTNDPETFFYSMLSSKDGKSQPYSYIKENTDSRSYQGDSPFFGFEYTAWQFKNSNLMGIQILYVLPDSPADGILKRGQWIFTLNGETITTKNYTQIATSSQITIGVGDNLASMSGPLKSYTLTKAAVKDHPVFVNQIIDGTNIAYLMYNHFTTGPGGATDRTFDKDLENAIKSLASEGAEDFILDLRYNGGGYVSSAQVLASALVPANYLNEEFCKLTYNDKQKKQDQTYNFISSYHSGLNLKRLFVICSSRTASASELVIAGLQPYFGKDKIIIVGETTEGKNVGSLEYKDSNYDWILHPIVCHVTNTAELDYSAGFKPTDRFSYSYDKEAANDFLYELGHSEEAILKGIIEFIKDNKYPDWEGTRSVSSSRLTVLGSSLDRKTKNGVLLNLQ